MALGGAEVVLLTMLCSVLALPLEACAGAAKAPVGPWPPVRTCSGPPLVEGCAGGRGLCPSAAPATACVGSAASALRAVMPRETKRLRVWRVVLGRCEGCPGPAADWLAVELGVAGVSSSCCCCCRDDVALSVVCGVELPERSGAGTLRMTL